MQKKKELVYLFFLLAPALVLMLYSYIGLNTRLMADDFCTFNDARRFKLLRFIWHWFNNWGGRYSAIATDELLDAIGAGGVRYVPLVVLMIWVVISSFMCREVLKRTISQQVHPLLSSALGVVVVFAAISISPGITKVLFWWNGMRTYIPPLIATTFHIACIYWAAGRLDGRGRMLTWSLASFMIALFSGGYNETFTAVQFMGFTALTGLLLLNTGKPSGREVLPLLLSAVAGSALALTIMLISPGAARRQDIFVTQDPGIQSMLEITLAGYFEYLIPIVSNPNTITAMLGLIFMAVWVGAQSSEGRAGIWMILLPIAGGLLISFASLLPSAYGLGKMPALRTFTVPTFVLVMSLGYSGLMLGKWISGVNDPEKLHRVTRILMLCAVFFVAVSSSLNAGTLYNDRGIYIEYADQWDDIDAQIKQAKADGADSITIPATNNWAGLDQPNQNPKYWATACYSEFYGIQVYGPSTDQ